MIRRIFFYVMILSVPAFLALSVWQSSRYGDLERELKKLEKTQETWVENNKRLIAGIALLSSPDRIEHIARDELGLQKKQPEEVLQISITDVQAVPASRGEPDPVFAGASVQPNSSEDNSAANTSVAETPASLADFIENFGTSDE